MVTTQPLWRLKNSLCEIHFFEQQILQVFLHFRVCFLSSLSQWSVDQKINACVAVSPSQLPGCSSIRTVMPDVNACFSFQLFCCCGFFVLVWPIIRIVYRFAGYDWMTSIFFFKELLYPPFSSLPSILMSDPNLSYNFHRKISFLLGDYEAAVPRILF